MRVAAVDCGTNSIRLLIADVTDDRLLEVDRRLELVRLGQDVDTTGRLAPEAMRRTFDACERYAGSIAEHGAERVRFVATSATRDADNRDEFAAGVEAILGVPPEVVSGDEEATLSYLGATRGLHDIAHPCLVVDIGGGSTEFVLGPGPGVGSGAMDEAGVAERPIASVSVDIGSVRLTERCLRSDPPTPAEVAKAAAEVDAQLDAVGAVVPFDRAASCVGLAGSVTTVAAMALGLDAYDRERVHLAAISSDAVHEAAVRLFGMTVAERRTLPFMHPGRADVIAAGAMILDRMLDRLSGLDPSEPALLVSEHDILDGIAWSLGG